MLCIMSYFLKQATHLLFGMLVIIVVCYCLNFIWLKESVVFLVSEDRIDEGIKTLKEINYMNNKTKTLDRYIDRLEGRLKEIKKEKEEEGKGGDTTLKLGEKLKAVASKRYLFKPLLILSLVTVSMYSILYAVFSNSQHLGFKSFQLNGIFFGINQIIGFLMIMPLIPTIRRKKAMLMLQAILIGLAAILLLTSKFRKIPFASTLAGFVSNFLISAVLAMYFSIVNLTNSESFPPEYKGMCVGIILFVGKLCGSFSPVISHLCQDFHIHILVGCSVPLIPAFFATMFLKETYNPDAVIEEDAK